MKDGIDKFGDDDHLVANIVSECLEKMRGYDTRTKMTACYNLMERILRLFAVRGEKDDVKELAKQFHEGIIEHIEEYYE